MTLNGKQVLYLKVLLPNKDIITYDLIKTNKENKPEFTENFKNTFSKKGKNYNGLILNDCKIIEIKTL